MWFVSTCISELAEVEPTSKIWSDPIKSLPGSIIVSTIDECSARLVN